MVKLIRKPFAWILLLAVFAFIYGQKYIPRLPRPNRRPKVESVSRNRISYIGSGLQQYFKKFHHMPTGDMLQVYYILSGTNISGQNPANEIFLSYEATNYFLFDVTSLIDGWGSPLKYTITNDSFIFYSLGANKRDDGGKGDDISVAGAAIQKR
jgi:hypothetical protein